jgi:hypothetical protein
LGRWVECLRPGCSPPPVLSRIGTVCATTTSGKNDRERAEQMAEERHSDRVHPETVVLDIGQDIGALIIYTEQALRGREIEVSPQGGATRIHVEVLERRVNGLPVFAAVFPGLRAGDYDIWDAPNPHATVTIVGGEVATVDWRQNVPRGFDHSRA